VLPPREGEPVSVESGNPRRDRTLGGAR